MTSSAAFFDLDRTLMSGSSAYYFGKAVYREGLYPLSRLLRDAYGALTFKLFGSTDEGSEALRDRILSSVAGVDADRLRRFSPTVVEDLIPRIRPEAQALLDMHAEAGRDVYIISASPVEIVGELARSLEITGGLGTESEIVDGRYTGRLAAPFCYGEGKAELIRRIAERKGYALEHCYSYSDSASDLPMMQIVGHPVAVNPDRSLMAVAHRRGWPIVEFNRERKQTVKLVVTATVGAAGGTTGYVVGRHHGRRLAERERALVRARRALPRLR